MIKRIVEFYPDLHNENDTTRTNQQRERLYTAILYLLRRYFAFDPENEFLSVTEPDRLDAEIDIDLKVSAQGFAAADISSAAKIQILAVYGRMRAQNMDDPALGRDATGSRGMNEIFLWDPTASSRHSQRIRIVPRFVEAFTSAVQNYNAHRSLYERVFHYLKEVGESPPDANPDVDSGAAGDTQLVRAGIYSEQLSEIIDRLVEERVSHTHPQLRLYIANAVGQSVGSGGATGGRFSSINVDLPDLDEELSVEILPDNVRALSVLYFAAQLEDMRFFSVADQVAQQFQMGLLPLTRGAGADNIFEYLKTTNNRFTEMERRGMYARAFGFAQGGVDEAMPNREFSNLWIRALSASSSFARQNASPAYPGAVNSTTPLINLSVGDQTRRVHHMQVYKSMRDLSVNLSLHGYAMAHYAAVELQDTIRKIRTMLAHPDLLSAFGVRDYFQLIERVARMYMNSEVNSVRQRVQAQAGSRVIQWLADKSAVMASPRPPRAGIFLDSGLVDNVEKWLAVTGTTGNTIDRYSEPVPVAAQPTIPGLSSLGGANGVSKIADQIDNAVKSISDMTNIIPEA